MRLASMFTVCLFVTACGGDAPREDDNHVPGDETPADGDGGDEAPGDGADASNDDSVSVTDSNGDDKPTDDEPGDGEPTDGEPGDGEPTDGEPGDGEPTDGEPADGEPGDDGPSLEDVWSCHTVFTVGEDGQTSTSCTEYRGENAQAFAEPGCMDIAGSAVRTLANAPCSLEGAILRCDYAQGSAAVFYEDSRSQLENVQMVCENQGAVVTLL